MMDVNEDEDSDRTETYTPPPLDVTNSFNNNSEKENDYQDSIRIKEQSIMILYKSFDQVSTIEPQIDNYWDQWPLIHTEISEEERLKLYSIPDIDNPPSPVRELISSPMIQSPATTGSNILDLLTLPSSIAQSNRRSHSQFKKPVGKRKKKKKAMSDYRPPSPFSPKPDYKSMDIEHIKRHAMRYGLSTTQAKGRLIKILDEIYNVTHQYETDTDYELETSDLDLLRDSPEKKRDLSHTPPTPAILPDIKKAKKRQAVHRMSSSDEIEEICLPPAKKATPPLTLDDDNSSETDEDEINHEGRFLELTVHELSSTTTSSSSISTPGTPPNLLPQNIPLSSSKKSSSENSSQASTTKNSKASASDPTSRKKAKLQTPTLPIKDLVRSYIESNPTLHARILCYEPIDFEEFHKQIKTDLNLKIISKDLMQCLDDQCITFTLRSKKGAFTSVMRAKRRHR